MTAGVKYQSWAEKLTENANIGTDQFKLNLSNAAPNAATHNALADITDLTTKNGYTAGGMNITTTSSAQTGGVQKLVLADITITADASTDGTGIGPFRYLIVRDSTIDALMDYYDIGSSITLAAGSSVTLNFDPTTGAATIT